MQLNKMDNIKSIEFNVIEDKRGSLVSLEQIRNIPFEIKRCYYIFNTNAMTHRGFHAHRKLEQVLICVSGTCEILVDNGYSSRTIILNSPKKGLYLSSMIWREMFNFTGDCVLMVLANEYYDESDYIRNYQEFCTEVKYSDS